MEMLTGARPRLTDDCPRGLAPMQPDSPNWVVLGDPASPAEQRALTAFRDLLPEDGITKAWVNLTFIDGNGRTGEIDVLLLSPVGFFVVELKGWHGIVSGTTQRWEQHSSTTGVLMRSHPNPLIGADSKAKRLSSLLKDYAPNHDARRELPFVKSLVVMHGADSQLNLVDPRARTGVLTLDGFRVTSPPEHGIPELTAFLARPPADHRDDITPHRAHVLKAIIEHAGFLPTPKTRMYGQYAVTDSTPISEGPSWHDVLVQHPAVKLQRRLRIFDVPTKSSQEDRLRLEQDAQRELSLTLGLSHEGIAVPLEYLNTESGPALVFSHDDAEIPLTDYLAANAARLTMDDRLDLVRQLGSVLRFAHDRRLVHRALAPSRVWVVARSNERPRLIVRDWYTGQKTRLTTSEQLTIMSAGVTDVAGATYQEDWLWLAPEALRGGNVPGLPLDVYGFGALSALILTGRPPAGTMKELLERFVDPGHIDLSAVDGLPDEVIDAVIAATRTAEPDRTASVAEALHAIERGWAPAPAQNDGDDEPAPEPRTVEDPLTAQAGDLLGGRFHVVDRRGEGSTGTAFVVRDRDAADPTRELILKVARHDSAARRLAIEAEVMRALKSPRIVTLLEGPIEVDGRRALLMSDAGKETLAARIANEGRATIGQLEQFGRDLITAAEYLDRQGVFHRDIKPANLGVGLDPGTRKPRLALFDLSLAREPLENIASGTTAYLDPYLGRGARPRYDRAAELWTVSSTLFEMATGEIVWWPGGSGPTGNHEAPVIRPEAFEASVATQLAAFFTKALSPKAGDRFGTVEDLHSAWLDVFADLDTDEVARDGDAATAEAAELTTPLDQAGLSARAQSGLARLDAHTVGDLLAVPGTRINSIPGLGERYRKEIQARIRGWRTRLGGAPEVEQAASSSIESLLEALSSSAPPAARSVVRTLLGLEGGSPWPTAGEVAQQLDLTRAEVVDHVARAVKKWRGLDQFVSLSKEVETALARNGRVLVVPELALTLAATHGSTLDGDARVARAAGLVRAVLEGDALGSDPAFAIRRRRDQLPVLALTEASDPDETGAAFPPADDLLDAAGALGAEADGLVAKDQVLAGSDAAARLRAILAVDYLSQQPDDRLLRLAASTAQVADVSGLGELYPTSLPVEEAMRIALQARPGRPISERWIRGRVSSRFPRLTARVPGRRKLDDLVTDALPGLSWDGALYSPRRTSIASTATRSTTVGEQQQLAEAGVLRRSLSASSALTLSVRPRDHQRAVEVLSAEFDVRAVDVSRLALDAARALAEGRDIRWPVALAADAGERGGREFAQLTRLMQDAVRSRWQELLRAADPLLLINAGPLMRYGMSDLLSTLLDVGTPRPAARWLLVPREASRPVPLLEGEAVPLGPGRWLDLPFDLDHLRTSPGVSA